MSNASGPVLGTGDTKQIKHDPSCPSFTQGSHLQMRGKPL